MHGVPIQSNVRREILRRKMYYLASHIFSTEKIFSRLFLTQKDIFRPKTVKICMGSPYNKMISAKFYVETWVRHLDTFFRHKRYFSRLFLTQIVIFYLKPSKYAWGPHTIKLSARNSTSKHGFDVLTHFFDTKDIFAPFFDTKDIFLTRTGTGTGPERGEPRPPGTRPQTTPGVDRNEPREGEQPPNSPKYHKKGYFSRLF